MRTLARIRSRLTAEPGFVLVGVVMFVLALTILGISLFSLSSYEAQFFNRSSDETAAFYAALGGLEHAKFALARTKDLGSVAQNLPIGDIVYARARRFPPTGSSTDSTGAVVWDQPVDIRVLAIHHGTRRMIEQRFTPQEPRTIYRRLITAPGVKIIDWEPGDTPKDATTYRPPQTFVDGEVHQSSADTTWTSLPRLDPGFSRPVYASDNIPHPDVANYRATFLSQANLHLIPPDGMFGQNHHYDLTAGGNGTTTFYATNGLNGSSPYTNDQYSVAIPGTASPRITVSGTAIWLTQYGFWADPLVPVVPAAGAVNPLLIIVAATPVGPTTDNAAIYFNGGLTSPAVPVILVSENAVDIEAQNLNTVSMSFYYLSIFAGDKVLLGGPIPPVTSNSAHFTHPSGLTAIDNILDALYDLGLLPNSNAGLSVSVPPVHRTWREVTESNPN